ncbi:MAG: cation:proton antiporter [Thiobacillaceae bacterium]
MNHWFVLTFTLLGTAALMAALCARFKLPTLLGYLAGGAVLGPSLTGIVQPNPALDFLAELGVVLLMFMVGLEFPVRELWATRHRILMAGGLQTLLTAVVFGGAGLALGADRTEAILLGGAAAMSSTALTAKQLADQGELTSRHGRVAVAVPVFQDIATIPMLTLLSIWGRGDHPEIFSVLVEVGWTLGLFALAAVAGKPILHRWLAWVARHGSTEGFLMAALMLVAGAAFAAHVLGLSEALGAFLAGVVLGESDFRHRVEDDIRPFRDLFMGLFFITVGVRLHATAIIDSPAMVLWWLGLLIPGKILLAWPGARAAGLGRMDAAHTAIILGHGGEFGLLLVSSGLAFGILPNPLGHPVLVAIVISMGIAPFLIRHHEHLARHIGGARASPAAPLAEEAEVAGRTAAMQGHVIVCGAGELGFLAARALALADIPYILVESDYEAFRHARHAGLAVLHGDASRIATLRAAGAARAAIVVITFRHLQPALRIARALRHEFPQLNVIATAAYERDAKALLAVPGVRVYIEEIAAGLAMAEQALLASGLDAEAADTLISRLRLDLQGAHGEPALAASEKAS